MTDTLTREPVPGSQEAVIADTIAGESDSQQANTIINVSNRLPVTIGKTIRKSSGGLVAALEAGDHDRNDLKWIGWPGGAVADRAKREELHNQLREEYGYLPVFLSKKDVEQNYIHSQQSSSLIPYPQSIVQLPSPIPRHRHP